MTDLTCTCCFVTGGCDGMGGVGERRLIFGMRYGRGGGGNTLYRRSGGMMENQVDEPKGLKTARKL